MNHILLFQDGLVLFFGTWFIETQLAVVLLLVTAATVFDVRRHRIPNGLVFSGALAGIAYHAFSPYGMGVTSSLEGLAVGLAAFMPFYLLRAMGAGDVKLMAMVGAFLGPASTLGAVLTTFIAGGVLAIAAAIRNGAMATLLQNLRFMTIDLTTKAMTGSAVQVQAPPASAGQVPYALAIAAGTATHIFLMRNGHALLS
ncbi:A24 family peptidase [Rhodoferax sediminis]|jgi:prepilin peptidase CpaA|uniref:Prepilin peptidase n=1 Tax=Rhodoferax sediminis TaxID=2509614 RepID=A0A515D9P1_9BURK|nr:A24 family peptidase [Rhodoferax sediminis]QDL37133.1 prepilin peptidase [Rhodoferax sediminis]